MIRKYLTDAENGYCTPVHHAELRSNQEKRHYRSKRNICRRKRQHPEHSSHVEDPSIHWLLSDVCELFGSSTIFKITAQRPSLCLHIFHSAPREELLGTMKPGLPVKITTCRIVTSPSNSVTRLGLAKRQQNAQLRKLTGNALKSKAV